MMDERVRKKYLSGIGFMVSFPSNPFIDCDCGRCWMENGNDVWETEFVRFGELMKRSFPNSARLS